jgi:hypothetical protein
MFGHVLGAKPLRFVDKLTFVVLGEQLPGGAEPL